MRYTLLQNKHNIQLFTQINGTTTFYIFNPKHESDIKNKSQIVKLKNGQQRLILNLVYYYMSSKLALYIRNK